ncbi:MAG: PQQ-dependent sugar dehydrogenase [Acidobacteriota bacterium]
MTSLFLLVLGWLGASLPESPRPARIFAAPSVKVETLETGLTNMTAITTAGDGRLFLTIQTGQILIRDATGVLPTPFLDLSAKIVCCGEQGLLSTAFHPLYSTNGLFFVDYTDLNGDTTIARYRVSSTDPNRADPDSAVILLVIDQPFDNHNGGQLQFGPDGFLYIGMGDGGSGNDPTCHAQSDQSLLGKLLRIDVDQHVQTPPFYGIPADNPFVPMGGPAEAWAKGLRNPWRFSFDRLTGDLFIGDVGQNAREEIDYQPLGNGGGQNYGWKVMEGFICGTEDGSGCDPAPPPCGDAAYSLPILDYMHDGDNCSVTGGYLYRGLSVPDLYGSYVYGDYCTGQIWAASRQADAWTAAPLPIQAPSLTTFGEDAAGDLYAGTQSGTLYRFVAAAPPVPSIAAVTPSSGLTRGGTRVTITGTNFTGSTQVFFGSLAADVSVQSPSSLIAVAPPQAPALVDVIVSNPDAPAATQAGAFLYEPLLLPSRSRGTPRVLIRP